MPDAPDGFEWKHVESRIGSPITPNGWVEFMYLGTGGSNRGLFKALVPKGQPAIKKVDLDEAQSLQ
jgi:hypothetical protein